MNDEVHGDSTPSLQQLCIDTLSETCELVGPCLQENVYAKLLVEKMSCCQGVGKILTTKFGLQVLGESAAKFVRGHYPPVIFYHCQYEDRHLTLLKHLCTHAKASELVMQYPKAVKCRLFRDSGVNRAYMVTVEYAACACDMVHVVTLIASVGGSLEDAFWHHGGMTTEDCLVLEKGQLSVFSQKSKSPLSTVLMDVAAKRMHILHHPVTQEDAKKMFTLLAYRRSKGYIVGKVSRCTSWMCLACVKTCAICETNNAQIYCVACDQCNHQGMLSSRYQCHACWEILHKKGTKRHKAHSLSCQPIVRGFLDRGRSDMFCPSI